MATLRVIYELTDDSGAVIQTDTTIFDLASPDVMGDEGTEIVIDIDSERSVLGVGGRPKNRQSPSA